MNAPRKKLIGQSLLELGYITEDQLNVALKEQQRTGKLLGEVLQALGFIPPNMIESILASDVGVPYIDVINTPLDSEAMALVNEAFARKYKLLPISLEDRTLTVAMADPLDVNATDELRKVTGLYIAPGYGSEADILQMIDQHYRTAEDFEELIEECIRLAEAEGGIRENRLTEESPIVRLVDQMLIKSIRERASDLHIEPDDQVIRSRMRIDGVLHQGPTLPKSLQSAISTRIKIMSRLNISETRVPQDGGIRFPFGTRRIDLRLSTFPTVNGENIVMRILDKKRLVMGLDKLGFAPEAQKKYEKAIEAPHGIILVTGPTGSGKTTTLYSTMAYLNSLEMNIMTVEDPVEYEMPIIRQCQVNPKVNLTFAEALRAILRQDPDVILVGEIRDKDTMELSIRAALTGHLVFSTIHTNDAASTIPRLIDMDAEPFLLSSSLVSVISQRLVRTICPKCKVKADPDLELIKEMGLMDKLGQLANGFYKGKGCDWCHNTGFYGVIGIFEILMVTPKIQELIVQRISSHAIRQVAIAEGMTTLLDDGLSKVVAGITTLEEVARETFI
jgi:type IV pilus assembly protein PilB